MKYLHTTLFVLTLLFPLYTYAQVPQPGALGGAQPTNPNNDPTRKCDDGIYSFNYAFCCGTFRSQNQLACNQHDLAGNTIRSGTPRSTTGGANQQAQSNASRPQSGASELQQCSDIKFLSILDVLIWIKCIIGVVIIPMLFSLATVFFLWGVLKYIRTSDSTKRKEAQKTIWAGLIGLFVMVSLWGIISIFSTMFGTGSTVPLLQTQYLKK